MNLTVPVWTWAGLALVLLMFVHERRGRLAVWCAGIFIAFGGMDLVRLLALDGSDWRALLYVWNIEGDGETGRLYLNYNSFTHVLMYGANHFISGALSTLLFYRMRHHPVMPGAFGMLLPASLFWSPYVTIGLLPLMLAWLVERRAWCGEIRSMVSLPNLLVSVPLSALLVMYLTAGVDSVPVGTMLDKMVGEEWGRAVTVLVVWLLTECVILAAVLCWADRRLLREPLFFASLGTLLVLPWVHHGYINDFVFRVSQPALVYLCLRSSDVITDYVHDLKTGDAPRTISRSLAVGVLAAILLVGSITVAVEVRRGLNNVGWHRYPDYDYRYQGIRVDLAYQYFAHQMPPPLRHLMSTVRERNDHQ